MTVQEAESESSGSDTVISVEWVTSSVRIYLKQKKIIHFRGMTAYYQQQSKMDVHEYRYQGNEGEEVRTHFQKLIVNPGIQVLPDRLCVVRAL